MNSTEELKAVLNSLNEIKEDIKQIKIDVNALTTSQAVLTNDGKWIKILYGVFSSIIIVLLGTLLNLR